MSKLFDPADVHMTIGDHLEELRRRIIFSLVGVGLAACVMLFIGRWLIKILCLPLFDALQAVGLSPQTNYFSPPAAFLIYLKVSLVAGIIIASPWVLYQLWRFIAVGLYRSERRIALTLIPFSAGMTVIGLLFMYLIMLPVCLWFFLNFAASYPQVDRSQPGWLVRQLSRSGSQPGEATGDQSNRPAEQPVRIPILTEDPPDPAAGQVWLKVPERVLKLHMGDGLNQSYMPATRSMMSPMIEIGQYIGFVTMLALGIVVAFQLPVIMLVLGWTGLVSPQVFAAYRRYCVFGCFVLGAILTPADVLSMFLLAMPLWGLFEFGLLLMRLMYDRSEAGAPPSAP